MRKILGVDPGLKGGLSIIDEQLNLIACFHMPTFKVKEGKKTRTLVCPHKINELLSRYEIDLAVIEKVASRPGQSCVATFSFGDAFGIVRAITEIHAKQVIYPRPQEWKGGQFLSGLDKEQVAEVAFNVFSAKEIYGNQRKDGTSAVYDGISDSLMIAKYGIRFLE